VQRVRNAIAERQTGAQIAEINREEVQKREEIAAQLTRITREEAKTQRENALRQRQVAGEQDDRVDKARLELGLAQRLTNTRGAQRDIIERENKVRQAAFERERAFRALTRAEAEGPLVAPTDLAKLRGDFQEAGLALSRAVAESGDGLREAAREAAKQLRDAQLAVAQAQLNLRSSQTGLAALRGGENGLGQFLFRDQQQQLAVNTLRSILPAFQANFGAFVRSANTAGVTGLSESPAVRLRDRVQSFARGDFNDLGRVSQLLRDVVQFNETAQADTAAQQQLIAAQNALADATRDLALATADNNAYQQAVAQGLENATKALIAVAGKDWNVIVQPPLATPAGLGLQ
jgi:hypothetical protein